MRVLLDEQLPVLLAVALKGHEVCTVKDKMWNGLTNGELLKRAAEEGFEVLVTATRNLEFQQNLASAPVGVILLAASSNKIECLGSHGKLHPGQLIQIDP